jgi:hypothetical protein
VSAEREGTGVIEWNCSRRIVRLVTLVMAQFVA